MKLVYSFLLLTTLNVLTMNHSTTPQVHTVKIFATHILISSSTHAQQAPRTEQIRASLRNLAAIAALTSFISQLPRIDVPIIQIAHEPEYHEPVKNTYPRTHNKKDQKKQKRAARINKNQRTYQQPR